MVLKQITRKNFSFFSSRFFSSILKDRYGFVAPSILVPESRKTSPAEVNLNMKRRKKKEPYRPPSSLDLTGKKIIHSSLPFDFRFSYTESDPSIKPIGLREPKYSPFGPGRVDRPWTGVCAPAVDPTLRSVEGDVSDDAGKKMELWRRRRKKIVGELLTPAERAFLIEKCQKHRSKRQVNLGRDGLTHNMLNDIHNNWKHAEAVRIKCLGVPTVDMKNVCTQLEDLVPCIPVTFLKEQIVVWRGEDHNSNTCINSEEKSFSLLPKSEDCTEKGITNIPSNRNSCSYTHDENSDDDESDSIISESEASKIDPSIEKHVDNL